MESDSPHSQGHWAQFTRNANTGDSLPPLISKGNTQVQLEIMENKEKGFSPSKFMDALL